MNAVSFAMTTMCTHLIPVSDASDAVPPPQGNQMLEAVRNYHVKNGAAGIRPVNPELLDGLCRG